MRSKARIGSHPIHPMVVGLPIGLWVGSYVFDLLGRVTKNKKYEAMGYSLAIAGCGGAVLAAVPGVVDWVSVIPSGSKSKTTGAAHGLLNTAALAVFGTEAYLRRGGEHKACGRDLAMSTAGMALLGVSGWLGGALIYDDHVSVNEPASGEAVGLLEERASA